MKKNFLVISFLSLLVYTNAQNVIPNPSFENWTNFGSYDDPDNWGTINSLTSLLGVKTVTKATGADVHSGTYAIHLESKNVPFQGTAPGIAATGTINTSGYIDGGLVYNKRPIAITGWYKYTPSGNAADTGSVEATLSKWNSNTLQREEVGRAVFEQNTTVGSYTQFTANFNYTSSNTPDTLIIILLTSSQGNNSPVGSKLYIDDLAMVLCDQNFSASLAVTDASSASATDGSISVTPSGGTSPYTYTWNTGNGSGLAPGNYCVSITDFNGCVTSACGTVSFTSSVTDLPSNDFKLYPNPANDNVVVETNSTGKFLFSVFNIEGRMVKETEITGGKAAVDIKNLPEGLYSCQLKNTESGSVTESKLQIQR